MPDREKALWPQSPAHGEFLTGQVVNEPLHYLDWKRLLLSSECTQFQVDFLLIRKRRAGFESSEP
jgi:hypothetical protein